MTWFVELMHRDGSVQTRRRVDAGEMRIGRALDNDLIIDDPYCAAHHALLRIEPDGSAVLQDRGHAMARHPRGPRATDLHRSSRCKTTRPTAQASPSFASATARGHCRQSWPCRPD